MDLKFGLTMMFMGIGVTLITLYILILVIMLLNKMFPDKGEEKK